MEKKDKEIADLKSKLIEQSTYDGGTSSVDLARLERFLSLNGSVKLEKSPVDLVIEILSSVPPSQQQTPLDEPPADAPFADYDLIPIAPGNTCSRFDGLLVDPPVFIFHEALSFRDDRGYSESAIFDRAKASVSRALGSEGGGRCGEECVNLPPFDPGLALEVIVRVV